MVVGDITTGTDALVIGGGPGGYVAAIRAADLGLDVTLVEATGLGGTCLNHGCIPSKALVSATDVAHRARTAENLGVYADPAVDLAQMVDWKDRLVGRLADGVESLCAAAGVTLETGRAEFVSDSTARIVHDGEGQGAETIAFEHAVVATGSRPVELPNLPFDGERVLSSRDALAMDTVPDSLAVVGAGYIGMELATVFQKLGSQVTVLEQTSRVLPTYEADVASVVHERATDLGVSFSFGETALDCEPVGENLLVWTETAGGESTVESEKCLVAVGREPVTDTLNLGAVAVERDDAGYIETDDRAETSVGGIFAVGDVTGEPMLAHAASVEGEVAAGAIAGEPVALDQQAMPAAVFTDPEVGTVGLTETEAERAGFDPVVGQMPLRTSGRALTLDAPEGFVRVVADSETGFVLGGQIVGPEAAELVAELALAVELGATLEDVAATVHVHPTLSEAVREAAMAARGRSVHS